MFIYSFSMYTCRDHSVISYHYMQTHYLMYLTLHVHYYLPHARMILLSFSLHNSPETTPVMAPASISGVALPGVALPVAAMPGVPLPGVSLPGGTIPGGVLSGLPAGLVGLAPTPGLPNATDNPEQMKALQQQLMLQQQVVQQQILR